MATALLIVAIPVLALGFLSMVIGPPLLVLGAVLLGIAFALVPQERRVTRIVLTVVLVIVVLRALSFAAAFFI